MSLYLGDIDLTVGLQGADGKSAYEYAKEQGFNGTEEEFGTAIANAVEAQMLFSRFNRQTTWSEDKTVFTETWSYNGDSYSDVLTNTDPVWTRELSVDGTIVGTWTITYDDVNMVRTVVYNA